MATNTLPILERCKFIAIFADMIDEFFQVRVVSLQDKVAAGVQTPSIDGVRPRQQLEAIRERVFELVERLDRLMLDQILPTLAYTGINIVRHNDLDGGGENNAGDLLQRERLPRVDPARGRPRAPFSHDLEPVAQHRGHRPR